ncbi:MAG: hypothetical protein LBQ84_03225, partial [Flavobacteriaceae bacterium]|nr:hypothetical protein [Flavobacteriaceae bacterium]
ISYGYEIYNSEYKAPEGDGRTLAIDNMDKEDIFWQGIPAYCVELDKKIPNFKDKDLKDHVRNYAGQYCDMYLSVIENSFIDERATLDQIRYEENYFRNAKFSKEDQKLLNEFLNSLD